MTTITKDNMRLNKNNMNTCMCCWLIFTHRSSSRCNLMVCSDDRTGSETHAMLLAEAEPSDFLCF
jgi:hypothetical protein